jgi:hypothetical protein
MLTKQLIRRAFGGQGKNTLSKPISFAVHLKTLHYSFLVSPKFPESTVVGIYKRAVAENQYQDAVRFGSQKINWTLKEFDVRSTLSS